MPGGLPGMAAPAPAPAPAPGTTDGEGNRIFYEYDNELRVLYGQEM